MLFAALHVYWAVGGAQGLTSSAGAELARERPSWFVLCGLWGVALSLLAAAMLGWVMARGRLGGRAARLRVALSFLIGAVLVIRGVGMEVVLLTDALGVASNVGWDQAHATLVLWNPWFFVGGVAFVRAGLQSAGALHR